jgi:GT2 family glycosyltransferase
MRSSLRGKGAALNEGLRNARGEIVVCTDDDCIAEPGWVAGMARAMADHPAAVIVFCNVVAVPHDRARGYVPAFERQQSRVLQSIGDAVQGLGLGAGMALRREAVVALGGFDEDVGPGGYFCSGDDWDIATRALLRGHQIYEAADLSILHDGFRSFEQGKAHARRDWVGIGAVCAKPLRAGHLKAAVLGATLFTGDALWPPIRDLLRLRRPRGLQRIAGFLQGFTQGLLTPVERSTLLFRRK